jgi:nucleoside-diphosphate-sugar epimerase
MKVIASGLTGTIGRFVENVNGYVGDVRNPSLYTQLEGYDSFLHLAGIVGVQNVQDALQESYEINVTATLTLAQECLKRNFSQFVYVSTSHVYGTSGNKIIESAVLNPRTDYAKQKLEAELRLRDLFKKEYSNLVIVRLFSILGAGMPPFTLGGLLDQISSHGNRQISFSDDQRDFLSPDQAAKALKIIAENNWKGDETINLCTGKSLSVKAASKIYLASQGHFLEEEIFKTGSSEVPIIVGDNSKLKEAIPGIIEVIDTFKPSKSAG